jgi:hypothetical protein
MRRRFVSLRSGLGLLCFAGLLAQGTRSAAQEPIYQPSNEDGLLPVEFEGFGDPDNTWIASMQWFRGSLYVGTLRSAHCVIAASLPGRLIYPPPHSDCAPDPLDLRLAAEIWRYTPEDSSWDLVYISPEDVAISPTKFTARDIAYTSMEVHVESNGTEALYVGTTSPASVFGWEIFWTLGALPPPRLLRSVDGITFQPVPQDPGTFLGNLGSPLPGSLAIPLGFRSLESLDGKLAALLATNAGAGGAILLSAQPASGNNAWAQASPRPEDFPVTAIAPFNDALYAAVGGPGLNGFSIASADVSGALPLEFQTVVDVRNKDYGPQRVKSMAEHRGRLYAGTAWPLELIRIDRDGSWEMVAGNARDLADRTLLPLSGIPWGLGNALNAQFSELTSHDGSLFVGTMDASVLTRFLPIDLKPAWEFGFDLLRSEEGVYWHPVSRIGLGNTQHYGVPSMASTPAGLFVGTATDTGGAQVWAHPGLPQAVDGEAPFRLESASAVLTEGEVVLSWEPVEGALLYHVYRSTLIPIQQLLPPPVPAGETAQPAGGTAIPSGGTAAPAGSPVFLDASGPFCDILPQLCAFQEALLNDVGIPGPFLLTSSTTSLFYTEAQPTSIPSIYFVRAQLGDGRVSGPSNVVGGASTAAPITFPIVEDELISLYLNDELPPQALRSLTMVRYAGYALSGGNAAAAGRLLDIAERILDSSAAALPDESADELSLMVYRLRRNVQLVEWGLVPGAMLM